VLHGDSDPVAPSDQVSAFVEEMRAAHANWEIDIYGNAKHSFTGEGTANRTRPEAGLHPQSEDRSWEATLRFLKEVLGQGRCDAAADVNLGFGNEQT
jgi:dienelactone hydrolase